MHADTEPNLPTVTHDDLAKAAGVSVTTIKSYRRKFPGFIPVAGFGKPIRFKPEATDICVLIQRCFAEGLSVRETRKRLEAAGHAQDPASVPPPSEPGAASSERMDDFLRAAGVMMQSVSKLAEAQRQTDARLEKLEALIEQLTAKAPGTAANSPVPPPATKKRVVKVRSSQGTVESYALDDAPAPPPTLLTVPVAIQTDSGEYLGLPGRLTLHLLAQQSSPGGQAWSEDGSTWRLDLTDDAGTKYGLCFEAQTTPAGLNLAVMVRLLLDGVEATATQRMDYFRQLKNRFSGA